MASTLGLLGKKKLTRVAVIDDITQFLEFDATLSTDHESTAAITRHPVEQGANVTDHIRDEPDVVEAEVIMSDRPLLILASLRALPSVPGGNPKTRAVDAYEFLRLIKSDGKLVDVTTKLRTYRNMAITRLRVSQDKDTSNIAQMNIRFDEIVVATTQRIATPDPVNPARAPKSDIGKQTKVPATPAAAEKSGILLDFFSSFG